MLLIRWIQLLVANYFLFLPPNFGETEVPIIGNVNSAPTPLTPDATNKSVLPSGVNNQRKPAVKKPYCPACDRRQWNYLCPKFSNS